jgi:hypothetical protein
MVAAGPEPARGSADGRVNDDPIEQAKLGNVENGVFLVGADEADEMVEDLSHTDRGQRGVASVEQGPDLSRGALAS